ncbi:precorrin-4 C(11)-methyltransferase [Vallitalea pronyensis]|uniref:Precorrin-4 C(11)-methyltransferase n=1 Tax=Vallitalea pronyensis TaxID=1348613 RepID=A0A8J8SFX6_9FIRM|nr:precorrin-4 C(11)-methyltransferase [Vallitalea pronyensis]
MHKVVFVGAGPGDPELITMKGKKAIDEADIIIYAGSLVNKKVLEGCQESAEIYNSASMHLDQVLDVMIKGIADNKQVVRVHTGDPSIYGAIKEQMDALEAKKIPFEVIPGVSSFCGAAAAIKKEFTLPDVSQTVILTRIEGRTPVPDKESLASLASHRASMAIFLSVGMMDKVVGELGKHYPMTTPIAVIQRATWEDEKIIIGTLDNIAEQVKEAGITKTAQILVGDFIDCDYTLSKLYDQHFTHEYRKAVDV